MMLLRYGKDTKLPSEIKKGCINRKFWIDATSRKTFV